MTETKELCYYNDDIEIEYGSSVFTVDVDAYANYWCDSGCMYMRNGDPGYPPEDEFVITAVNINSVIDNDTGNTITDKTVLKDVEEKITDWLYGHSDSFEEM